MTRPEVLSCYRVAPLVWIFDTHLYPYSHFILSCNKLLNTVNLTIHTFAAYIRERTKLEHAQLEKKLIAIIRNIRTKDQYVALLRLFHGFYYPLELKMDQYLTKDRVADIARRRKSAAILLDIRDLGGTVSLDNIAVATKPEILAYPEALGAAYVQEGSTLGGIIIARMIKSQVPQLQDGAGFSFFTCYGEDAAGMWRKFHTYLDALIDLQDQERAVIAARQTFSGFNDWIEQHESVFKI